MHGENLPDWARDLTSPLDDKLGVELLELGPERVAARMPVEGNTQPFGLLHGGANAALVETLGSLAAHAHARTLDAVAVGVDLNITHHRGVTAGRVHGVATPIHRGRSVASYQVELSDDQGNRTATGRITCLLRQA
ncbi:MULTISPECIES: PaaI family thioesterase [unclassified Luteococcus]|uniref:PaaI family thioesterase n=1 Tax=unclassified Luteococcus TaxID=2639923 RepID=UPI00313CE4F5